MGDFISQTSTIEEAPVQTPNLNGRDISVAKAEANKPTEPESNGTPVIEPEEDVVLPVASTSDDTRLDLTTIKPTFHESDLPESTEVQAMIDTLQLIKHIEGGYFNQTDASPITIPWPPSPEESSAVTGTASDDTTAPLSEHTVALTGGLRPGLDPSRRRLSTTIFYFLTPRRPMGSFHRNRNRIVHTLHRGRGRYVLIHPGGRVESFIVGQDIARGERLQWVVEGGVWKASFLLPLASDPEGQQSEGLLISETVVPGFEYIDHEFLSLPSFKELLPVEEAKEIGWLVREEKEEKEADVPSVA